MLESHRLQEMMSDIEAGLQSYTRESGEHEDLECASAFEYIWYE